MRAVQLWAAGVLVPTAQGCVAGTRRLPAVLLAGAVEFGARGVVCVRGIATVAVVALAAALAAPAVGGVAAHAPKAEVKRGHIVYELSTDKAAYGGGGVPVDITFTVTNTGDRDATFRFATTQQYDFVIKRGDTEVTRWSLGQTFAQEPSDFSLTLAPGKSLVFTTRWLQKDQDSRPVPPGMYEITAILTTTNPVSVSLRVALLP